MAGRHDCPPAGSTQVSFPGSSGGSHHVAEGGDVPSMSILQGRTLQPSEGSEQSQYQPGFKGAGGGGAVSSTPDEAAVVGNRERRDWRGPALQTTMWKVKKNLFLTLWRDSCTSRERQRKASSLNSGHGHFKN